MKLVVVGVDGSGPGAAALRFAAAEARAHGARLRAVTAWSIPAQISIGGVAVPVAELAEDLAREANETLDRQLDAVASELEGVEVERVTREGQAARVVLDAAKDADLLIVGSRGRGGFSGLLLGSVSQQCAHHSTKPIVIVRAAG